MGVVPARSYAYNDASGDLEEGIVTKWPVTTILLIGVFIAVFSLERHVATPGEEQGLSPFSEILLGGLTGRLVEAGQWYRLLSSAFLHANTEHLIGNVVALALAGYALERIIGHAWIFCIFALGSVCGGLASIATLPASLVAVGASGGIMAILGALFMTSFRLPKGHARSRAQGRAAFFGIPSLIPHHLSGTIQVDYADHFGGVILGLLVGGLLLGGWEACSRRPPYTVGAPVLAALAMLASGCSAYAVSNDYVRFGPTGRFIPPAQIPRQAADILVRGEALAVDYPGDARAHFYAGIARLLKRDRPGAEGELQNAIMLDDDAPGFYPAAITNNMHILLAALIFQQGRTTEAVALARPFCEQPDWRQQSSRLAALATAAHLCR
nr:rhomboid family intramembrane serine protease [uncultured Lichenicoccus sp.]